MYVYIYIYTYTYIYIYIYSCIIMLFGCITANLPTNIVDFKGFDSSTILI